MTPSKLSAIWLLVILLSNSIIAQEESSTWLPTDESNPTTSTTTTTTTTTTITSDSGISGGSTTSTTTSPEMSPSTEIVTTSTTVTTDKNYPCDNYDYIPLFGGSDQSACISRSAFTGIFLTSIILGGLSFIMIIGFMAWSCLKAPKISVADVERAPRTPQPNRSRSPGKSPRRNRPKPSAEEHAPYTSGDQDVSSPKPSKNHRKKVESVEMTGKQNDRANDGKHHSRKPPHEHNDKR